MSRVRRLVAEDAARHASDSGTRTDAVPAADGIADDPLALLEMAEAPSAPAAEREPQSVANGGAEDDAEERLPPVGMPAEPAAQSPLMASESVPLPSPIMLEAGRPELLDVIASLTPVLRAVQVFPGPDASHEQVIKCIRMLSQDAVRLADLLARETDAQEIDMGWRRRRAGVLTAEIVADHWLSTVIKNHGVSADDLWPTEGIGRIAAAFQAAIEAAREMPQVADGELDIYAATLALAPVLVDLQRMAGHMAASSPDVVVDVDSAALAIATTACEEVAAGVGRLSALMPAGASALHLASELMARAAQMAQAALSDARGNFYARLKAVEHDMAAYDHMIATQLQGGLPVTATCETLRTMMRRLVGMSVYACQSMFGAKS